ncbi:MAG: hypothetical protein NW226_22985 [Microscillaceae bacterium]|nr:hypothetical protein [Microscillaceae bacterium]
MRISNTKLKIILGGLKKASEAKMWTEVGKTVRESRAGVGRVVLAEGSPYSRQAAGEFIVVGKEHISKVKVKGGQKPILDAMIEQGAKEIPEAREAFKKANQAAKVRAAFRVGGRVLLVIAIAADTYSFIYAKDKLKEATRIAGGWTGAALAGGAFATWFAPADAGGPWAWIAHGLGTLVAGAVGYLAGSKTTVYIYELTIEE